MCVYDNAGARTLQTREKLYGLGQEKEFFYCVIYLDYYNITPDFIVV